MKDFSGRGEQNKKTRLTNKQTKMKPNYTDIYSENGLRVWWWCHISYWLVTVVVWGEEMRGNKEGRHTGNSPCSPRYCLWSGTETRPSECGGNARRPGGREKRTEGQNKRLKEVRKGENEEKQIWDPQPVDITPVQAWGHRSKILNKKVIEWRQWSETAEKSCNDDRVKRKSQKKVSF